jgi:hypothetical protein
VFINSREETIVLGWQLAVSGYRFQAKPLAGHTGAPNGCCDTRAVSGARSGRKPKWLAGYLAAQICG